MPQTSLKITMRAATADDHEFLVALFASTRTDELQALSWDPVQARMFITIQYNAQQQGYRFGYPSAENNIILLEQKPIGRILIDRSEKEIHLVDIAVLPDYRNQGVGSDLLGDLLEEGLASGRPIVLSVFQANPAIHLYERLGFIKFAEESPYWKMRWLPPDALTTTPTSN